MNAKTGINRNKVIVITLFCISSLHIFCNNNWQSRSLRKKSLRILFVIDKFPHEPRWYINNQITGLLDEGFDVYILAYRIGQRPSYSEVEKYGLLERTFYNELPKNFRHFDIIYCQFGGMGNWALKLKKRGILHGKLIVCFRGGDVTHRLKENPHRYDKLFKDVDLCFPICEHFKNILIKHGCDEDKINVHYSAIDCSKFKYLSRHLPRDGKIKIVSVGRLIEMKGIEYSIRAIEQLKKLYPNAEYEIIGEGPLEEYLKGLIKKRKLEKYVKLVGYLKLSEVIKKLDNAHIFLHTPITTEEGEQDAPANVVKEAMATGLPVVATEHGGIPELVQDGISGFLVPEKNVKKIVEKLIYLIKNSHEWASMGKAGSTYVRKFFDKKSINKKLIRIFLSLIRNK